MQFLKKLLSISEVDKYPVHSVAGRNHNINTIQISEVDNHFDYSAVSQKYLHTGHAINMGEYPNVVRNSSLKA